jgi:hypothetical protein
MVSRPLTAELVPRGMAQEILSGQSLSATRRFTFRWTACGEVPNSAHGRRWHKRSARPLWLRSSGIRRSKLNSTTSSRTAPHRHVHGGASRGDGTGRAGHASVSCPLVQPGRPVDLRSLPTGNVDIALNTVRVRKRAGSAQDEGTNRGVVPTRDRSVRSRGYFPGSGRVSHRSVGSQPLSRSPRLRRAGGTRTRDLVHPKHAR